MEARLQLETIQADDGSTTVLLSQQRINICEIKIVIVSVSFEKRSVRFLARKGIGDNIMFNESSEICKTAHRSLCGQQVRQALQR